MQSAAAQMQNYQAKTKAIRSTWYELYSWA